MMPFLSESRRPTGRRRIHLRVHLALSALVGIATLVGAAQPVTPRSVAVTFDDLPAPRVAVVSNTPSGLRENTARLLGALEAHGVAAVGFVNEGKLVVPGEDLAARAARTDVLRMWLDAGMELGNHTYSHPDLNTTPLADFEEDLVRGEPTLVGLLSGRGQTLRYFRHPFLHVGLDLEKRQAFERFLAERGYTVAPVTVDNDDYIYAALYAKAMRRGDTELAGRIAADYLRYMESVFEFVEGVSQRLAGREIPQVLLLHANAVNADTFGRLAEMLKRRGYGFVTLEKALADDAYRLPDTYVGKWGISWLHHWEQAAGLKRSPSPNPPDWIMSAFKELQ